MQPSRAMPPSTKHKLKPRATAWLFQPDGDRPTVYLDRGRADLQAGGQAGQMHELFLHAPLDDTRIARGLEIADQAMLDVIVVECESTDEQGLTYSLDPSHERYAEIYDAVTWLVDRGLLTMLSEDAVLITADDEEEGPW